MTAVEVLFRYGMPPGEMEMGALGQVSDVYGIRRVRFHEPLSHHPGGIRRHAPERVNRGKTAAQCRFRYSRKVGVGITYGWAKKNVKGEGLDGEHFAFYRLARATHLGGPLSATQVLMHTAELAFWGRN